MIAEVAGLDRRTAARYLAAFDCRNNRLAQLTLEQGGLLMPVARARAQFGAARIGVFLGTSTSGHPRNRDRLRHRDPATGDCLRRSTTGARHNSYSVVEFVRSYFDLTGRPRRLVPPARRVPRSSAMRAAMIEAGLIDAAVVGASTRCA